MDPMGREGSDLIGPRKSAPKSRPRVTFHHPPSGHGFFQGRCVVHRDVVDYIYIYTVSGGYQKIQAFGKGISAFKHDVIFDYQSLGIQTAH